MDAAYMGVSVKRQFYIRKEFQMLVFLPPLIETVATVITFKIISDWLDD